MTAVNRPPRGSFVRVTWDDESEEWFIFVRLPGETSDEVTATENLDDVPEAIRGLI